MKRLNYSITESSVVVFIDGEVYTVPSSHPNYRDIIGLLLNDNTFENAKIEHVLDYMDIAGSIERYAEGRITIEGEDILYKGESIPTEALVDRILSLKKSESNFEHLIKFLDNLMENPHQDSRDDLYRFLSKNNLPITNRGTFLAYKKVRADYTDVRTGEFSNGIGDVVSMPREDVDPDRNNTCSAGFHAASYDYMDSYSGDRVVVVEIDPADVVSVPVDHDDAKLRCCRYTVVGEIDDYTTKQIRSGFVDVDEAEKDWYEEDFEEEEEEDFWEEDEDEEEYLGTFPVEERQVLQYESNGALKTGYAEDFIPAGYSLKEIVRNYLSIIPDEVRVDATLTNKTKDVSSKDRYLVKVTGVDEVSLNVPKLYAPNAETVHAYMNNL